jgi:hypothetical protein
MSAAEPAKPGGGPSIFDAAPDAKFLVFAFPGEGKILAQRLDSPEIVPLHAILGDDVSSGLADAIDQLWPECPKATRRMLVALSDVIRRTAGGVFLAHLAKKP